LGKIPEIRERSGYAEKSVKGKSEYLTTDQKPACGGQGYRFESLPAAGRPARSRRAVGVTKRGMFFIPFFMYYGTYGICYSE